MYYISNGCYPNRDVLYTDVPKHPKTTIGREEATAYARAYYNPDPDPRVDLLYPVQSKKEERVVPGPGSVCDSVRVSQHGEFRQVYAKSICPVGISMYAPCPS